MNFEGPRSSALIVRQKPELLILVLLAASLTGCVGLAAGPVTPPTVTFTASPASILPGQSTTLTWTSTDATTATISGGIGQVSAMGSTKVKPTTTTTYTLTANGSNGGTVTATVTVTVIKVTITAKPTTVDPGQPVVLAVTVSGANSVVVTDNIDTNSYPVPAGGGSVTVYPIKTVTYTATATFAGNAQETATVKVTVNPATIDSITHVIFEMQENHTFDNYFGMLNPYRVANKWTVSEDGHTYTVDGIDDKLNTISNVDDEGQSFSLFKLASTCIDDDSSAWLQSYGDVNRYDFLQDRPINMDGFVHTAEGYAKCGDGCGNGDFTDLTGQRAMGYYDQTFLNYYYYMASQFAVSDRWFSPVSAESTPNRIATMTGGTTQGLVHDPGSEDKLNVLLDIETIFQELDQAGVSWKIYYTATEDACLASNDGDCGTGGLEYPKFPSTTFTYFKYSQNYLYGNQGGPACVPPTMPSGPAVGDPNNNFCIDTTHIAPVSKFFIDLQNNTLPSFAWIEPGYSVNDEHPGSGQSILLGQAQVASLMNALMASSSWGSSVFFWSYDEGGGPYDHVPPVPGHTIQNTDPGLGITTDISSIAVNPDSYNPCVPADSNDAATLHCDLWTTPEHAYDDPGVNSADAPAVQGFAAQLGFRLPNMIISPYVRMHYVSHTPMDHTAVISFVENRFIGAGTHLTAHDAAQPDLTEFFDFTNVPWVAPPTPPTPYSTSKASATCTPANMGP